MTISPALKGRNKILDHKPVLPLQGLAILNTGSNSQGGALGWHVTAPSGRDSKSELQKCNAGTPTASPAPRAPETATRSRVFPGISRDAHHWNHEINIAEDPG